MSSCVASSSPFCSASWLGEVRFLVASSDNSSSTTGDSSDSSPTTEKKSRRRGEESLAGMTSELFTRETPANTVMANTVILRRH